MNARHFPRAARAREGGDAPTKKSAKPFCLADRSNPSEFPRARRQPLLFVGNVFRLAFAEFISEADADGVDIGIGANTFGATPIAV